MARARSQPLKLGELAQAVVLLAFAFAIPVLAVPTIAVLTLVLLERLGLTFPGKLLALLVLAAIAWLSLEGFTRINGE